MQAGYPEAVSSERAKIRGADGVRRTGRQNCGVRKHREYAAGTAESKTLGMHGNWVPSGHARTERPSASPAKSANPLDVEQISADPRQPPTASRDSASVSRGTLCVQTSKVRTVCVRSASTDLCGGCRVTRLAA